MSLRTVAPAAPDGAAKGPPQPVLLEFSASQPATERPTASPVHLLFLPGDLPPGLPSLAPHLCFRTALEGGRMAQGRTPLAPGCPRRISASPGSCPGPADTQRESMMAPPFLRDRSQGALCLYGAQQKSRLFHSCFQCSIGQIYLQPPQLVLPKNERLKFQKLNFSSLQFNQEHKDAREKQFKIL